MQSRCTVTYDLARSALLLSNDVISSVGYAKANWGVVIPKKCLTRLNALGMAGGVPDKFI